MRRTEIETQVLEIFDRLAVGEQVGSSGEPLLPELATSLEGLLRKELPAQWAGWPAGSTTSGSSIEFYWRVSSELLHVFAMTDVDFAGALLPLMFEFTRHHGRSVTAEVAIGRIDDGVPAASIFEEPIVFRFEHDKRGLPIPHLIVGRRDCKIIWDGRAVSWASAPYPCPCCGHLVFVGAPGSHEVCPICFWEDDVQQLLRPDLPGGANAACLVDAQLTYARVGASEERFILRVRAPGEHDAVDAAWRPIDRSIDRFVTASDGPQSWPEPAQLFWWRQDYWLRNS